MDIPLDEVIHFDAISSASTGEAVDADSTPTFAVYEESTDTDIGVGGNMTKRTSLTGNYRGSFTASAANGFEVGKWYNVIGSATIGGIATKGILKAFRIVLAESVVGEPKVDVGAFGGVAGTFSGGRAEVNTTHAAGTAWNSGAIGASTIATGAIDADALATDAVEEIRNAITGGAYDLDTDANGRIRIVDGTGAGEIATTSGAIDTVLSVTNRVTADVDRVDGAALATHVAGYFPGDTRRWNGSAPANLSSNGYVQSMLLRWLTDDAAGTPGALIGGRVRSDDGGYIDDFVYFQSSGASGTVVGTNGTFHNPSNSFVDAYAIAVARGTYKIRLKENATLPASNFDVPIIFDLNGYNLNPIDATFEDGDVQFSSTQKFARLIDVFAGEIDITGHSLSDIGLGNVKFSTEPYYVQRCAFLGTMRITSNSAQGAPATFQDCYSDQVSFSLNMGGIAGSTHVVRFLGWAGDIALASMRAGQTLELYGYAGNMTIAASCTGGTIKHTSHHKLFESNGTTPWDYTNTTNRPTVQLVSDPTHDDATLAAIAVLNNLSAAQVQTAAAAALEALIIESGITAGAGLTNDAGTQLTSINLRQAVALIASAVSAVLAGAATTNITTKQTAKPSGNTRIDATVDASGNRSALTLKVPT